MKLKLGLVCLLTITLLWQCWLLSRTTSAHQSRDEKGKMSSKDAVELVKEVTQATFSDQSSNPGFKQKFDYGSYLPPQAKKYIADPNQRLDPGFEWTDLHYDPEKIEKPGYREQVVDHIYAKHYYEAPARQLPLFQDAKNLLEKWGVESSIEHTVMVHDAAHEWHIHRGFAEMDSGPAAGPEGKKNAEFRLEFQRKNIIKRFEDLLGINDKAFFAEVVEIRPESGIGSPLLKITPGDRLMKISSD